MNFDSYNYKVREHVDKINSGLARKDKSAVKLTEDLIITAFSNQDRELEGYARYKLAVCYYRLDYPEEEIREALNKAIIFLTPIDDRVLISSAYNLLGILEAINNRQNLAMDYFVTALGYCDTNDDKAILKKFTIEANISFLYFSAGEVEYAIEQTAETIKALCKIIPVSPDFRLLLFRLYCVMGIFYCEKDEPDLKSAEKYLDKAENFLIEHPVEVIADKKILHLGLLIMIDFMRFDKSSYNANIAFLLKQIGKIVAFTDTFSDIFIIISFLINHEEYFSAGKIIEAISVQVKQSNFPGIHASYDELMINYLEGSGMDQSANEASHRYYQRLREKKPGDAGAMLYSLNLRRDMQLLQMQGEQLKYEAIREKAANEAKTSFLSNMSHELRTPINAVLGMDEMILRESSEKNILEYAENIRNAGNSLLSIINDILDFSKIEAGKLDIIPSNYYFSSLLNSIVIMLETKAVDKNLFFELDIDENIPDLLFGDEMRIKQILLNLLNNAVKYTEKGGIFLIASFKKISSDMVEISFHIKDSGIGIKKEDLDRLFAPFERIDPERNKNIEGTGLGISITTKLLGLMDSKLNVDSEYCKGSDFSFSLKQKVIDWMPIGDFKNTAKEHAVKEPGDDKKFTAPDARILVVDDTEMNLIVIKNLLKRTLIKVDTAISGAKALEMIENEDYNIIFMDHRMPKMNGDEAMKKIRELPGDNPNRDTPIIILTANAVSGMREKFLEMGFDDFVSKPISSAQLEETIMKFLPDELIETGEIIEEEEENESEFIAAIREINYGEFDIKNGIIACGGSETYESVLKLFAESSLENTKIIYEDFVKGNLRDYTVRVHALKSSARLAGLTILSKFAERLEKCGENGEWDEIKIATPLLLGQYNSAAEIIRLAQVKSSDEIEGVAISTEMIDEAFSAIREFADAFDFDSADGVMQELKKYKIPEERLEIYRKLEDFMGKVERNQILDLLIGY